MITAVSGPTRQLPWTACSPARAAASAAASGRAGEGQGTEGCADSGFASDHPGFLHRDTSLLLDSFPTPPATAALQAAPISFEPSVALSNHFFCVCVSFSLCLSLSFSTRTWQIVELYMLRPKRKKHLPSNPLKDQDVKRISLPPHPLSHHLYGLWTAWTSSASPPSLDPLWTGQSKSE